MSIITLASQQSIWRGYDYYRSGKVRLFSEVEAGRFEGIISGSAATPYRVTIDTAHPRKSNCTCPHAKGRIVCKHMVALYFAAHPEEAERYYMEVVVPEEEAEALQEELEEKIDKYIYSLKKEELQELVFRLIADMTEWQFDDFVRDFIE